MLVSIAPQTGNQSEDKAYQTLALAVAGQVGIKTPTIKQLAVFRKLGEFAQLKPLKFGKVYFRPESYTMKDDGSTVYIFTELGLNSKLNRQHVLTLENKVAYCGTLSLNHSERAKLADKLVAAFASVPIPAFVRAGVMPADDAKGLLIDYLTTVVGHSPYLQHLAGLYLMFCEANPQFGIMPTDKAIASLINNADKHILMYGFNPSKAVEKQVKAMLQPAADTTAQ